MKATTSSQKIIVYLVTLIAGSVLLFFSNQSSYAKSTGKGWLGVGITELTPSMTRDLGLKDQDGLMIENVFPDSPAEKAGLREKDIILSYAGKTVRYVEDLTSMVQSSEPGTKIKIELYRKGKTIKKKVEIGKKEDREKAHADIIKKKIVVAHNRPYMGIHIQDIDENLAGYFKVEEHKGVLITEVIADTPAEKAGLKSGDVIVKIGNEPIHYTEDIYYSLRSYEKGDTVPVEIVRQSKKETVDLTLDSEHPVEIKIKKHGDNHIYDFDSDQFEDIHIDLDEIDIDVDHIIEGMETSMEKLFNQIGI